MNSNNIFNRLHFVALAGLVLIIYAQTFSFEFISDDLFYLNENYLIRHPYNVWKVINIPENGLMGELVGGTLKVRNLRDLSYAVDYWIWGGDAYGFHVTNILLHLLAGLLLYRFGRIYLNPNAAFIGTALFLLHPVNTEVVAYISGRKESLMSIAALITLLTLEKSRNPGYGWLLPLSLVAYFVSFFFKEVAITVVGLIVLKDILLFKSCPGNRKAALFSKRRIAEWALFCLAALIMILIRFKGIDVIGAAVTGGAEAGGAETSLGVSPLFLLPFYTIRFLIPIDLQFEYRGGFADHWLWLINSPALLWSFALLLIVLLVILILKARLAAYLILWFYIALTPVLHIIPFHTPAAEHYLYLPGMALSLLVGHLINKNNIIASRWSQVGIYLLLFGLTYSSTLRTQDYKNDYTLFKDAYLKSNNNQYAYFGMLLGGVRSGDIPLEQGINEFEKIRQRHPEYGSLYYTLGYLYEKAGKIDRARRYYEQAIHLGKRPWEIYIALARLEIDTGNSNRAEDIIKQLNDKYAYHPTAYILLGNLKIIAGEPEIALKYYQQASRIDIHSKKARIGTNFSLWQLDQITLSHFFRLHPEMSGYEGAEKQKLTDVLLVELFKRPAIPGILEVL